MLKDKGQLSFEDKWPSMRPTILKLLRQETVTRSEWHDLFWLVHSVCLWDEKGPPKVYGALRDVSLLKKIIMFTRPRFQIKIWLLRVSLTELT